MVQIRLSFWPNNLPMLTTDHSLKNMYSLWFGNYIFKNLSWEHSHRYEQRVYNKDIQHGIISTIENVQNKVITKQNLKLVQWAR